MTSWGSKLGRKVFGETIPETVLPLLGRNGMSPISAQTFGRAIEFDSGVREPLDALLRNAADGSDDAYMILDYAETAFKKEDDQLKSLSKAQRNLAKQQRTNWNVMTDRIEAAPRAKGEKGRRFTANVAQIGRQEPPKIIRNKKGERADIGMMASTKQADYADYTQSSVHSGQESPLKGKPITQVHHGGGLDDLSWIFKHQSYQAVTPETGHPLIELGNKLFGIEIGNSPQNTADILGWMTKRGRQARVAALSEQVGDVMHSKTIDDLLGTSDFKPREMSSLERSQFEIWNKKTGGSVEEFMDTVAPDTGGKRFPQGSAGKIEIWKPGANIRKDKPLEVIELTPATYPNRVKLAFDAYQRNGIDVTEVRKKWNRKLAKIDPNEEIFGVDHPLVHTFINTLKDKEGTALNAIAKMSDDEIFNLPMEEAFKLYVRQLQEMETVLANVLQYRYKKVKEIFKEFNPDKSFEKLDADEKRLFFRKNVNTIAVRGNIEQDLSLNASMRPVKNWNNHIADTFGWSPQSLWTTIKEIEELAEEFAQKVPVTQPIPGV